MIEDLSRFDWIINATAFILLLGLAKWILDLSPARMMSGIVKEFRLLMGRKTSSGAINLIGIVALLFFGTLIIMVDNGRLISDAIERHLGGEKASVAKGSINLTTLYLALGAFAFASVYILNRTDRD